MCQVNEIALTKYSYVTRLKTSCSARRMKHGSCRRVSHKGSAVLREKKILWRIFRPAQMNGF